jgi:hypothetical protein
MVKERPAAISKSVQPSQGDTERIFNPRHCSLLAALRFPSQWLAAKVFSLALWN